MSNVHIVHRYPSLRSHCPCSILVYDRRLNSIPMFRRWSRWFPQRYAVTAGEKLKSVDAFPRHIKRILKLTADFSRRDLTVVVVGGGSVLDFGGFVASVLKRGVRLVFIPSTWLAAIDAAHGGKTALNVDGAKNQIGTFYPAHDIYIVKQLLMAQPQVRAQEAMSELVKMALIDHRVTGDSAGGGPPPARSGASTAWGGGRSRTRHLMVNFLWRSIPGAIRSKNRIIRRDPREENGTREILNLGHTLGHILEAHFKMAHGVAVSHGLRFAIEWSRRRYGRQPEGVDALLQLLPNGAKPRRIPAQRFVMLSGKDKKRRSRDRLSFVFLRGQGQPVRTEVKLSEFLTEARRQGWAT